MRVDFYELERPIQDRFADASRSIGVPRPLARIAVRDRGHWFWFAGTAASLVALVLCVAVGFADSSSPVALAPVWMMGLYSLLAASVVFTALRAFARREEWQGRPYSAGLYLFPVGIVDARRDPFTVYRLPELTSVEVVGVTVRVATSSGGRFDFPQASPEQAEQVCAALQEARRLHAQAEEQSNRREAARLDPLIDSGFSSPFSPKLPIKRRVAPWGRFALPIAVGAGVAMGGVLWLGRNKLSERQLFERAQSADSIEAYRSYLARGGQRSIVRDILLPRAELRAANEQGSVAVLEQFLADHPDSKIRAEIDAALRAALLAELEEAKAAGSIAALHAFLDKRKDYPFLRPLVIEATEGLYRSAYESYLKIAGNDEAARKFIRRLLEYTRLHGARVDVQFVRRATDSIRMADAMVRASAYYMGEKSVPSQYFRGEYAAKREAKVANAVADRFGEAFSAELLNFEQVEPIVGNEDPLPPAKRPMLRIIVAANLAGGYMNTNPRGVFVGVGMQFESRFIIPGDDREFVHKAASWRRPNPVILRTEGKEISDVYEDMVSVGYERFTRTLLEQFFAKP